MINFVQETFSSAQVASFTFFNEVGKSVGKVSVLLA